MTGAGGAETPARLVRRPPAAPALDSLCACLADNFDIEHSTFQIETEDRRHHETASHA